MSRPMVKETLISPQNSSNGLPLPCSSQPPLSNLLSHTFHPNHKPIKPPIQLYIIITIKPQSLSLSLSTKQQPWQLLLL
ncbi:hypothetical protein L6452_36390 [Arctium lappa]|uniref:Uncharacterized protein n=1 Tax=Arctium lappa TaxID=4217 RepID=A0ACB8Y8G2_ARCLA|nr:hypothetical protein L6452_36390 [Arctium lappa]